MDAFLLAMTIILAVLLFFVNFYLLALYCHPDDRGWGASLFCKILVIVGLTLAWAQVLMLPLDVSNSRENEKGGIDMKSFWFFVFMIILALVVLFLPFAQFFYETDEDKPMSSRCCSAIYQQFCYLIIVCLLLFISYAFLRYADIPVSIASKEFKAGSYEDSSIALSIQPETGQINSSTTLTYEVSFPMYAVAFMSFFGYIFFVLFGGVGLTALPMDLITTFTNRPKIVHFLSTREGQEKKQLMKRKTNELIEQGLKLREDEKEARVVDGWWAKFKEKRRVKSKFNAYKNAVRTLDLEFEIFKLELEYINTNPIIWFLKLIIGLVFVIVSFFWWLHILIFIVIKINGFPAHPFLNKILLGLEQGNAGFIATGIFAFLSIYLLWCTQKGNIKFGVRIPFLFQLHIMKVNETWMNTFLFNVTLILICSVAITHFNYKAFQQFCRLSTLDMFFGVQIQYLRFFTYFYKNNVFEIALLVWSVLTMLYLCFKPSDKPKILQKIEELEKQRK